MLWDFLYLSFPHYLASESSTETNGAKTKDQLRMSLGNPRILEQQESCAAIPSEAGRMLNTGSACPTAVFVAFHHDKDAGKKFAEGNGYSRRKDYHREASMQSYFLLLIFVQDAESLQNFRVSGYMRFC